MSNDPAFPWNEAEKDLMAGIDTTVPVSARIWNYWMGGKDYYAVDKEMGDRLTAVYPRMPDLARSSRYFISRVVRHLAGEVGIRQFLDIGTGLPSHDNTHEVAQRVAPECRVVYADNDPLVLAHARALLTSAPQGTTDYIDADLREPGALLGIAREKLDFTQPIALMLMGILGHLPISDDDDSHARSILERLKAELPSGSYLAIYDGTATNDDFIETSRLYKEGGAAPYNLRTPEQVAAFFDGFEVIEPGIVQINEWRPDPSPFESPVPVDGWGGVGRKP